MDQLERFMNENKGDLEYEELFTEMYVYSYYIYENDETLCFFCISDILIFVFG